MVVLESVTTAKDLGQLCLEPPLGSSPVEMNWGEVTKLGDEIVHRQEKLAELRFMDIKTASLGPGAGREIIIRLLPELPFDQKSRVPKLALPWLAWQEHCFVQASPRKCSTLRRWRRVRRQSRDNPLKLNIDFFVLAMSYSLGIIGRPKMIGDFNRERVRVKDFGVAGKRRKTHRIASGGKGHASLAESCLVASDAVDAFSSYRLLMNCDGDCNRKRVRVKDFSVAGKGRKAHRRAIRDKRHASFVESYLIASDAGDAFSNYRYRHRTMLMNYDGDRSEDRQSEEVQSAYRRDSDIGEEMVISEEQTDENEWSWVNQGKDGDPLAESVSSLHTTQQVLESGKIKILLYIHVSHARHFKFACVLIY